MSLENAELSLMLLVFFVTSLALLARRMSTPYPIVLVIGGLLLSLIPRVPHFTLRPDLVFVVFLPPLLFAGGYNTSWRDFRFNLVSIAMLAFGLVTFTVVCAAAAARWLLPGFTWGAGLVLGAVVATTDAVAATAIGRRMGLPRQLLAVIEGESLINDATGLLALQFAIAVVMTGQAPSIGMGLLKLVYLTVVGSAIGLGVGWLFDFVQAKVSDVQVQILLSLVTPYIAYLAAERIHASGILSVVVAGMYLGYRSSRGLTSSARVNATAVWRTLDFALNGFIFILIGLQLPYILAGIRGVGLKTLLRDGLLFSLVLLGLRLIWVFPGAKVAYWLRSRLLGQRYPRPPAASMLVVSWAGMRGVVALAAAFSLPERLADGSVFAQRNAILFLTFCVIFFTLVVQGLSLPWLIGRLGLASTGDHQEQELRARKQVLEAAVERLEALRAEQTGPEQKVHADLVRIYRRRLLSLRGQAAHAGDEENAWRWRHYRELTRRLRDAEREQIARMRDDSEFDEGTLRKLERELDLLDLRVSEEEI